MDIVYDLQIPVQHMDALEAKLAKLSRKSERLGLGEIGYEIVGHGSRNYTVRWDGQFYTFRDVPYNLINITGHQDAISVGGHTFKGMVNHQHSEPMWYPMEDGFELPAAYRTFMEQNGTHSSFCEHCNSKRNRHNTFILQNDETGEFVWVGSSCIRDYLGWSNAKSLVNHLSYMGDICTEEREGCGLNPDKTPVCYDDILPGMMSCIRKYGFVSKKMSDIDLPSTSRRCWEGFWAIGKDYEPFHTTFEDADDELAYDAVQWWLAKEDTDEFTRKIQIIMKDGFMYKRDWGLVAYAMSAYVKHIDDTEAAESSPSNWFGEEGKRHKSPLQLTVSRILSCTHSVVGYNTTVWKTKAQLKDADGNVFIWSSSKCVEEGDVLTMDAVTIKAHEEYKGVKQTVITRPHNLQFV